VTYYTLFLVEHGSRVVHLAGSIPSADERFMAEIACRLTDCGDGFLLGRRFRIFDRDAKFALKQSSTPGEPPDGG